MVADDHERARPVRRVDAAGRVGQDDDLRPEPPEQQDRLDDEPGVVALVQVEAALEHHDRDASQRPSSSRPTWPGAVAAGQPGRSSNGIATASSSRRRGRPGPTRGRCRPRGRGGAGPDRRLERVEPGGLIGRRDRAGRVGASGASSGVRASEHVQGEDGRGPRLRSARRTYRHRDAGRVPPGDRPRADRSRASRATEAPEATGPNWRPLM